LDAFFWSPTGTFLTTIPYRPYFLAVLPLDVDELQTELVRSTIERVYTDVSVTTTQKHDLDAPNHLSPVHRDGRVVLQIQGDTTAALNRVRLELQQTMRQHDDKKNPLTLIQDLREYDVPYTVQVCIDQDIRAGTWYTVSQNNDDQVTLTDPDAVSKASPTVLAFDIECTKAPLQFPNATQDEIFMISYMVSTPTGVQGYLINSATVVTEPVPDFEYTPQPQYPGPFAIYTEPNEEALLRRFLDEYQKHAPHIVVTYNGDFFDWPFVEQRALVYGMDMRRETSVALSGSSYRGRVSVHLDAFHWVQRDSYLPQGAQGLKQVTRYKLGYDPVEVDPEDMVRLAQTQSVQMATYSVSDAVATYYLYEKYVHLFIFSLCTIIPMAPEDVLGKGSGTLCETLLMAQAVPASILCPNKHQEPLASFHQGHLLESETYIGGKVECLETGVYRSDVEYDFDLQPAALDELIGNIDRDLRFAIEVEGGKTLEDYVNYEEVKAKIIAQLAALRDDPVRKETPYIYHLDVGAMYPNIILSNRLQPSAIVDDAACAACDYNQARNQCKRRMEWVWRGDYNPASRLEYERTRDQLSNEQVGEDQSAFHELSRIEQAEMTATRLKAYARRAYNKTKVTEETTRTDVVCMRENDFYVETVRQFRDRRYEYKALKKTWSKKSAQAPDAAGKKEAEDRVLVYDSLQVAHKCILNSFYGYVMRKGARWRSMEMAGIVTKNGADIITQARKLVERIGRPLELDTDGIWCILPGSFPDVYSFQAKDGSCLKLEYPCVMLNAACHDEFTNHQYQTLVDPAKGIYKTHSECSIFFEVDGPYRCMVLPASTEEGKLLKKRYAVFNFDGSLAELKGFELKRRGELELIKTFQSQVFERFLDGGSLSECYDSVAEVANHWIDVIETRGESLDDDELVDLISENRSMSRQLEDYGDQKGTSQTTARRLGEFLGSDIIKNKGLNCRFIIAEQPYGAPVTERAIPTAIWKTDTAVKKTFLRKWLKAPGLDGDSLDMRSVLDWDYYLDRLGKTIQKIITIPAALQKVPNPVPRVKHPQWLEKKILQMSDSYKQTTIEDMFSKAQAMMDIEDALGETVTPKQPIVHKIARRRAPVAIEEAPPRRELGKDDFQDWLKSKKFSWRKARRERKQALRERGASGRVEKRAKAATSMEGYIRDASRSLAEREWQIVEAREMKAYDVTDVSSSGTFAVWAIVGGQEHQKITISLPRIVYVASTRELVCESSSIIELRKVEKHLPHGASTPFLYEVTLDEHIFQRGEWVGYLMPKYPSSGSNHPVTRVFEGRQPPLNRVLSSLGSIVRVKASSSASSTYSLSDLVRVEKPNDGEYLNFSISYKRSFLYVRMNQANRTGAVVVVNLNEGSGSFRQSMEDGDITRPSSGTAGTYDLGAVCQVWIVKPGSRRSGQRNLSSKECESMCHQLIETVLTSAEDDSEYKCISASSSIEVSSVSFVETEALAYANANDALTRKAAQSMILLNSSRPKHYLRRYMTCFGSSPVVVMPFPSGATHNPELNSLPALNWEGPSVQLAIEAYLYMSVVSFPKRVAFARYGQLPLGNLDLDENVALFDNSLARLLLKNRALSWASNIPGKPDVGQEIVINANGSASVSNAENESPFSQNDIWEDDDELVSPVMRQPGTYRSICVDIDVHDLAIAALSENSMVLGAAAGEGQGQPPSPTSVALFDGASGFHKTGAPLGNEMSTSVSLPVVCALVNAWLKDASHTKSIVADELLHHVYRLLSSSDSVHYDPALHRVVHGLMKAAFQRIMDELKRLGCNVVFASFHRITVATNKLELADAEEYINFVISTAKNRSENSGILSKVTLRPRLYHCQFIFLDEFNFGTIHLERASEDEARDGFDFVLPDGGESTAAVIPSVVTGWSLANYLGSELAQEYFRVLVGRFSKDVLRKQIELLEKEDTMALSLVNGNDERLQQYKETMVTKHFAFYLTRAVDEILKDEDTDIVLPPLMAEQSRGQEPALEFIKNVVKVLELDKSVETQVQSLKRSLLAQLDIPEYSRVAHWVNPCPKFILPDVFCCECQDSRDVNLCYIPPRGDEEEYQHEWICEDCGTPYDVTTVERRLLHRVQLQLVRYHLQDIRRVKTKRVVTRVFEPVTDHAMELDMSPAETKNEIRLLHSISELHNLDTLRTVTSGILGCHRIEE